MPRKDGSGPKGQGPKTGRGTGNCAPATPQRGTGQGRGNGRGGGRGR